MRLAARDLKLRVQNVEQELHTERIRVDVPDRADYQFSALCHALTRRDAALWHVVGAGKTRVALTWGLLIGRKLLYCTRASARRTAEAEVAKWTNVKAQVLMGTNPFMREGFVPGKRKALIKGFVPTDAPLDTDADVYIIGYEVLPFWAHTLAAAMRGNSWSLVFDEIHHVKSYKRNRGADGSLNRAAAAKLVSLAASRRLGITGTPVRDRPKDLWAELDLIEPGAWGSNWDFVHRYCDARESSYGGLDTNGSSNEQELRTRVDSVVHRVGYAEVQRSMPPKVRTVVRFPESELEDLEKSRAQLPTELQGRLPRSIALASILKLTSVVDLVESKIDGMSTGTKVAVFTYLRSTADAIAEALRKRLKDSCQVLCAHGGATPEKRDALRGVYMAHPGPVVLVGTGDAWGESVSLNDTDTVVFAALPFTPGQLEQWEGRFHRKGQVKHVEIIYTVAVGTSDEHIANILLNKLPAVDQQVSLGGTEGMLTSLEDAIGMNDSQVTEALMSKILAGEST